MRIWSQPAQGFASAVELTVVSALQSRLAWKLRLVGKRTSSVPHSVGFDETVWLADCAPATASLCLQT